MHEKVGRNICLLYGRSIKCMQLIAFEKVLLILKNNAMEPGKKYARIFDEKINEG